MAMAGCYNFPIKQCSTDADCQSSYCCLPGTNICKSGDFQTAQYCFHHDMCSNGEMCDGTGQCRHGYILYPNTLNCSMEAQVFSELRGETGRATFFSHYLDGSSPWENVPAWLELVPL